MSSPRLNEIERSFSYIWDVNTLSWIPYEGTVTSGSITITSSALPAGAATAVKQDTGNTSIDSVDTKLTQRAVTAVSGSVSASGNNTCITPTAGKKLRIHYLAYNPVSAIEAAFRFGASGQLFLRNKLAVGGSVIAKDFGDFRYVEGAINEALILNLDTAVATIWNANYIEV